MNGRRSLSADRRRRKLITILWALSLSAIVITLIVLEKSAILYILATVGISVLLAVVAFSDLAHIDANAEESSTSNRSAGSIATPASGRRSAIKNIAGT